MMSPCPVHDGIHPRKRQIRRQNSQATLDIQPVGPHYLNRVEHQEKENREADENGTRLQQRSFACVGHSIPGKKDRQDCTDCTENEENGQDAPGTVVVAAAIQEHKKACSHLHDGKQA